MNKKTKIAIIGCGYVADFYMTSAKYHQGLDFAIAYDNNPERLKTFCDYYKITAATSLEQILQADDILVVLNLTNPNSHYALNKLCLSSGKHVYSEKPLAMTYSEADELARLAKQKNLHLCSAPCSMLSETAQTVAHALKNKVIGDIRLVYANFDAGMSAKSKPWLWRSQSGAPWPAQDEFEVGCTYEHAGYILTWLALFFGSATSISSYASCIAPNKGIKVNRTTPDFSTGCIEYANNIVAKVTCSLAAPSDRSLTIIGDDGVIYVKDIRDDACPVYIRAKQQNRIQNALEYRIAHWQNRLERLLNFIPWSWGTPWRFSKRYPFVVKPKRRMSARQKPVDFCRGIADLAAALHEQRRPMLSADLGVQIVELTEALQHPERFTQPHQLASQLETP